MISHNDRYPGYSVGQFDTIFDLNNYIETL
jgi:hypothetical protein